jgi:hypothetical protein
MICDLFNNLTPKERVEYIGELIHACQSDDVMYQIGKEIIKQGNQRGLFEGVVIFPDVKNVNNE